MLAFPTEMIRTDFVLIILRPLFPRLVVLIEKTVILVVISVDRHLVLELVEDFVNVVPFLAQQMLHLNN